MGNPYALPDDEEQEEKEPYRSPSLAELLSQYVQYVLPDVPPEDVRVRRIKQEFMMGASALMMVLTAAGQHSQAAFDEACQNFGIELARWTEEKEAYNRLRNLQSIPRVVRGVN